MIKETPRRDALGGISHPRKRSWRRNPVATLVVLFSFCKQRGRFLEWKDRRHFRAAAHRAQIRWYKNRSIEHWPEYLRVWSRKCCSRHGTNRVLRNGNSIRD